MAQANSLKSILYALFANLAIAIAKLVAASITKSGAMLAEGIHSLADSGNQLLLLLGMKTAKADPSPEHPLGHGKSIYFWSFVVAVVLFSLGGAFSLYEGYHKLTHPEPIKAPWVAIGVLIFGIVVEGISMRACMTEVKKVLNGRSYWQWFRESRQSELIVIFGEDLAALLGLVLAVFAVSLTMVTGDPLWDALGTLAIGVLLVVVAILIAKEVKALIIGQGVESMVRKEMLQFLHNLDEVEHIYSIRTLQMGNDVLASVKARMSEQESAQKLIDDINAAEVKFREAFPQIKWMFFEPDNVS